MEERKRYRHAYCIFCRTGAEIRLRDEITKRFGHIRAIAAIQEKHRIIDRRYEIDRRIFLPGYLFLYSDEPVTFEDLLRNEDIFRILGDEQAAHELHGGDRAFADWLLKNDGLIGMSRIRITDGRVHALSGPMQYFARQVVRLNKHTRNALVRMDFLGTVREIWLAFEFDDEPEINGGEDI